MGIVMSLDPEYLFDFQRRTKQALVMTDGESILNGQSRVSAQSDSCLLPVEATAGKVLLLQAQDILADPEAGSPGEVLSKFHVAGHFEVGEPFSAPVHNVLGL